MTNKEVRAKVAALQEFKTSNGTIYAKWETPTLYVVYSYGPHFPMYLKWGNGWFYNREKYSKTTSRHQNLCHLDGVNYIGSHTAAMIEVINEAKRAPILSKGLAI